MATYSLHHLTDGEKVRFLRELRARLRPGGAILIGDVAFKSLAELKACRAAAGENWDEEEVYFVADELREAFPQLRFEKLSPLRRASDPGRMNAPAPPHRRGFFLG